MSTLCYQAEVAGGHDRPELITVRYLLSNDPDKVYTVNRMDVTLKPEMKHNIQGQPEEAEVKRQRKAKKRRDEERKKREEERAAAGGGGGGDGAAASSATITPTATPTALASDACPGIEPSAALKTIIAPLVAARNEMAVRMGGDKKNSKAQQAMAAAQQAMVTTVDEDRKKEERKK